MRSKLDRKIVRIGYALFFSGDNSPIVSIGCHEVELGDLIMKSILRKTEQPFISNVNYEKKGLKKYKIPIAMSLRNYKLVCVFFLYAIRWTKYESC